VKLLSMNREKDREIKGERYTRVIYDYSGAKKKKN